MNALVVGGSGLVGQALLDRLSSEPRIASIISLGRSPLPFPTSENVDHRVVDLFGALPDVCTPDVVFCCLGTTIKDAGSQDAFLRVDRDLPIHIAKSALQRGAEQFIVVSAMGADPSSRVFYNRVKGELENELVTLGYSSVAIVRPSLLLGDRRSPRLAEEVGALLMQTFAWLIPAKWKAVHASDVASVMLMMALDSPNGTEVVLNSDIHRLAQNFNIK